MDPLRRLRQTALLAVAAIATLIGGMVGFHKILGESWFQSLYRAIITATLTGLDTVPRNDGARAHSIVMAFCGLTIIAYAGAVIVEAISGGVLTGAIAERRRQRTIEDLRDHFIICGYGRVGRRVADEMRASGAQYVVVDVSDVAIQAARDHGDLMIEGNATHDEALEKAGLLRARGLVVANRGLALEPPATPNATVAIETGVDGFRRLFLERISAETSVDPDHLRTTPKE